MVDIHGWRARRRRRRADAAARWGALDRSLATMAGRPERERLRPSDLLAALDDLSEHGELATPPRSRDRNALRVAQVRTVTRRLIRQNRYEPAGRILALVVPAWQPDPTTGLHALAAHAATSLSGHAPDDLTTAVTSALTGADRAWVAGDATLAAELLVIGAGLLLHRDLHADVERSPLADDPKAYLAPLRRSSAMAALRAAVAHPVESSADRGRGPTRVVVLPGTYPRFAAPLVELLGRQPHVRVDVVDLPTVSPSLRWLGTDPELVRLRLLATRGGLGPERSGPTDDFGVGAEVIDLVRAADVVVADWGDRGAMWASLVAPRSARLVLRLHGMDALSLWVHTLDWSRVDVLLTVSPHHAALVDEILRSSAAPPGERLPRSQAVPNVVRLPASASRARAPRTLGMVGWGSRVKDPLWAVEVLAGLRRRGGDWRLRLVGEGFRPGGVVTAQDYARRFEERVAAADVAGAVHHVPQTDDVAAEVGRLGFVLSSSRRESFHVGLVEGVLGGAVPVVRDWPFYARWGGPKELFPRDWVVTDVEEAVERIWRLQHEEDRDRAAEQAQLEVARRFDPSWIETTLLGLILGDTTPVNGSPRPAGT